MAEKMQEIYFIRAVAKSRTVVEERICYNPASAEVERLLMSRRDRFKGCDIVVFMRKERIVDRKDVVFFKK